jgi:hypothetical protein
VQPLMPAPPSPQPQQPATPPVVAATPPSQPATATPAPAAKIAPPAEAKPSGGFFDGIVRFFSFGGGSEAKPDSSAPTAAAPTTESNPAPAPTPVAPLPATGKITPPAEVSQEEGFLESLARFFSGKSKTGSQPDGAAKPQSSLPTPPPAAQVPVSPVPPQPPTATAATATKAATTNAGTDAPPGDSLFDHIARVLTDAQSASAIPAAENPRVAQPAPKPAPQAVAAPAAQAVPEPVVVPVKATIDDQPIRKTAKPGASILDDIAHMLSATKATGEVPPQPALAAPQAAVAAISPAPAPAPGSAPVLTPDAVAVPDTVHSPPATPKSAQGDGDKGEFLGRVTEFFSVGPTRRPTPEPPAPATETAMAAAPKPAVAPLRRAGAEPTLGAAHRLGKRRPQDSSGVCVDKSAPRATFCVEPVDWPPAIAAAFEVQTAIYRGRQAIVRYDDAVATQFHAMFPTANFQKIVDHFTIILGPPGDTPQRSAVVIGERNRNNRTARWLGPQSADGEVDIMLEVREIDDMRWSTPPDLDHGVVRLYRPGGDIMYQHVSWSDFLLARMRRSAN